MTTPDPQHVFISYSTKDLHFVERLRAKLRDASIPYWIDKEGLQPGTRNWEKAIRTAIQNSFMVILVASPNSVESDYVADEIEIARNIHQRIIVPVWTHGDHWNACVPLGMGKMQYVDLRGDSFDTNISHLLQAIDAQRGANGDLAESVFLGLDAEAQARFGHVFFRLFALDEQDRPISLRTPRSYFPDDEPTQQFIQSLIAAKLLVEIQVDEEVVLEVAHEALLRNWDRLAEWIAQTTENKRLLQKLEVDAAYWASRGKPRDPYRYTHEQEIEIEAIREHWGITFSPLVQEFLQPQIVRWVEDLVEEGSPRLRKQVAEQELQNLGTSAVHVFINTLASHPEPTARKLLVEMLGRSRDPRAIEPLIAALADPDETVGCSAAEELGQLSDLRAVAPLISALADPYVGRSARNALKRLGGTTNPTPDGGFISHTISVAQRNSVESSKVLRGVDPLIAALSHSEEFVKRIAAWTLGQLDDVRAVEPLIATLTDPDGYVRMSAVEALGRIGDPRALEPLVATLTDRERYVRSSAVEALGNLNDPRVVEPLIATLTNPVEDMRRIAAEALGRLGDLRAVPPLIKALTDHNWAVRNSAAEALGRLGDPRALEPLTAWLGKMTSQMQQTAQIAIEQIRNNAIGSEGEGAEYNKD